jgi:uncharacterized protein YvpB
MKLKATQNTVFKQYIRDAQALKPTDKANITTGQEFEIHSWKQVGRYYIKIALLGEFLGDPPRNTWYVFTPHVQLIDSQGNPPVQPPRPKPNGRWPGRLPQEKILNIPYKSQLDNAFNPTGSCNVTSFAMVMNYFQVERQWNTGRLADELYNYMSQQGLSRHEPEDLVRMARDYGVNSNFTARGSLADIRKSLAEGKPCILHGYFTSFGHILVVRGYDDKGFYVNDPYGEWTEYGYRVGANGANLYYSNALIQSKCSPEGRDYLWLHRLTRA